MWFLILMVMSALTNVLFVALAVLQLVISNLVYPLLQGRQLAISPLVIVLAMAFWAWMWGIAGALIAIPLTAAIIIVCEQFDRTRWFAELITREPPRRRRWTKGQGASRPS